jgi:hypothetical protein
MEKSLGEELRERFRISCRICGSENVGINWFDSIDYGEWTGIQPGTFTIGCNYCKGNDFSTTLL